MRLIAGVLSVLLVVQAAPASAISARDLRRLIFAPNRASSRAVVATATRKRVVQPPRTSACPAAVLDQSVLVIDLLLDGDFIYVSDFFGSVVRVPKNGGTSLELFVFDDDVAPGPIAADATTLYFLALDQATELGAVYSLPKAGGTPVMLASGIELPAAIAIDDTHVYWLDFGTFTGSGIKPNGKIERVTKTGESRQTLVSGLSAPLDIALDATDVYFGELGFALGNPSAGLRKVGKSGGTVTKLTDGRAVAAINIVGTEVFYSSVVGTEASDPQVSRIATSGGTPTILYRDGFVLLLRVDGEAILIMGPENDEIDFLATIPRSGGSTRILRRVYFDSYSLAFDACAVYYGVDASLERSPR